jgi:hypothetical protein
MSDDALYFGYSREYIMDGHEKEVCSHGGQSHDDKSRPSNKLGRSLEWQHEGQHNYYVPLPSEEKPHFPIYEPPKKTMDLYNHIIVNGPHEGNSQNLKSLTWLNEALKDKIEEVRQSGQDINDDGTYNVELLSNRASKLFVTGRKFFNIYQLKEFITCFADAWGFVVCMEGSSVKCYYAKPKKSKLSSKVSPSKRRKVQTSFKEINCTFEIKFSRDDRKEEKEYGQIATPVTQLLMLIFYIPVTQAMMQRQ